MPAGPPSKDVEPPGAVRELAAGRPTRAVWENEAGGITFEVAGPQGVFIKWAPIGSGLDFDAEAQRLSWASPFIPVPRVLETGRDGTGAWLVTSPVSGETAIGDRWRARPEVAVKAIGVGLRALHETLPVGQCPFSWSAENRVEVARRSAATGALEPKRWHPEHRTLSVEDALHMTSDIPPIDRLVVCHGDACAPNTLIDVAGNWSGHVDFGALGVADRWADIAVATWSTEWNYGPGWETTLLAAYGVEADARRTTFYRLLWDLG